MFETLFGGGQPDAPTVSLDPGTVNLINQQSQRAGNPALESQLGAGTTERSNQFMGAQGANNYGKSGMSNSMNDALRRQYSSAANTSLMQLKKQVGFDTPGFRQQLLNTATAQQLGMNQINNQNQMNLQNANNQWSIARANALSGILGFAGQMGGMAYAAGSGGGGGGGGGGGPGMNSGTYGVYGSASGNTPAPGQSMMQPGGGW